MGFLLMVVRQYPSALVAVSAFEAADFRLE
jgi:hypothetical protein